METVRRRRSIRMQGFDYRQAGAYFITICTHRRRQIFGQITDAEMLLQPLGKVVVEEWLLLPQRRPEVELDEFMVMPNHFHAVVWMAGEEAGMASHAPTRRFGKPPAAALSAVVGGFKAGVAKRINMMRPTGNETVWQRNYYEHVIRDDDSLNRIREYILTNPKRWELDRENPRRRGEDEFDLWLAKIKDRPSRRLVSSSGSVSPSRHK